MSRDPDRQPLLFEELRKAPTGSSKLLADLMAFRDFGTKTQFTTTAAMLADGSREVTDTLVGEFWTSAQRKGNSLHEVSYRACFKPQLPAFFIERLSKPGDIVHDPFAGRGTTLLEAALRGRVPAGCDVNPLSAMLLRPRLAPPELDAVQARLQQLDLSFADSLPEELLVFYHRDTLAELCALREYLLGRTVSGELDAVDDWIRMVAVGRLTGHSNGFFSVYTLPPNQAVSIDAQRKINERREQEPSPRDVRALVLRKSQSLLKGVTAVDREALSKVCEQAIVLTTAGSATPQIEDSTVQLVVTSPPFLDVVQYRADNWLRCWFCGIDPDAVPITMAKTVFAWQQAMREVFDELLRVIKPGGHVALKSARCARGRYGSRRP